MIETQTTSQVNPIVQSTQSADRATKTQTIYDVSLSEVFLRNLVAGMGRAFGQIILYLIFIFIVGFIFTQLAWPRLQPLFDGYLNLLDSLEGMQNMQQPQLPSGDIQELLKGYGI